jgi:tRNA threonylcarbamoyl adenosine modification protein YjeE
MHIATNSSKLDITAEKDTANLAIQLSEILKKGDVVFLYGEIGVGKTTFVRHLINNLQKKNNARITEVTSPTFNLVNQYEIQQLIIEHYDLFRIKKINEISNIGLLENMEKVITLIEWPEKIQKVIKNKIEIFFEYADNSKRRFIKIVGLKNATQR